MSKARALRDQARELIATGIDPAIEKQRAKLRAKADAGNTFGEIAREFIDKRRREGKRDTLRRTLSGARAVTLPEVLAILDAAKLPGEQALLLMPLVGEEFAFELSGTSAAEFLLEFLQRVPLEVVCPSSQHLAQLAA